jgi:uncharacterized iron-regulated membrane protein
MDWIERWFGVEPDGGDGSLEWTICIALFVLFVGLGLWTARRRKAKREAREASARLSRSSQQEHRS